MKTSASKKTEYIKIPWKLLAVGFIFIFNPNVTVVDVLPDFIGYIIISCALTNVAMICDTLFQAKKLFEKMILLDVGKYFAIAWVFGVETAAVRASSVLLWSFVFGALEIAFLIPSYTKLFKGISELGDYYPNTSIHSAPRAKGKSFTQRIRNFTVFFIIFKALMTVLPEFTDFNKTNDLLASNNENLYRYIGTIRFLCCIPVLVVGIIWAVSAVKYFLRISKDIDFNNAVAEKYKRDVSTKKGIFAIKNIKIASWFMIAASFFALDVIIDDINLLPDIFASVLLAFALAYFAKTAKMRLRSTYVFLGIFSFFSILTYVVDNLYNRQYTYNSMNKDFNAFVLYMIYVGVVAIKGVFFILMYSSIVKKIKRVTEENTGYIVGQAVNGEADKRQILDFQKEINKGFEVVLNFAVIYVVSDVALSLYGAIYAFLRKNAMYLGIINTACGIVFIYLTVRALDELREAVKTKYMLE